MSSYHTKSLKDADIFTVMGSVYAEVARYDSAVSAGQDDMANQAIGRAKEIINFANSSSSINSAQKLEVKKFGSLLSQIAQKGKKSNLDDYLMPFALGARMRQFK